MSAERTIREAIAARAPLALKYDGERGPDRTVHPQVLFRSATGRLSVDCYQVAGPSSSGKPLPGWRDFDLAKIDRLEVAAGSFRPAPGLNLAAPKYAQVLAHV